MVINLYLLTLLICYLGVTILDKGDEIGQENMCGPAFDAKR